MIQNRERVALQILRTLNNLIFLHYSPCFCYFDDINNRLKIGHLIDIPINELPPQTEVVLLHTLKVMKKLRFEYGMFSDVWLTVEKMNPPLKVQLEIDSEHVIEFTVEYLPRFTDFRNSQALDFVEYNFEYKVPNFQNQHLMNLLGDMNDIIVNNMDMFELKPKSLCDWYYRLVSNNSSNNTYIRQVSSRSLYIMQKDDYDMISTKFSAKVAAQDSLFDYLVREMKMEEYSDLENWKRMYSEMYKFIVAYLEPRHQESLLNVKLKCWYMVIAYIWTFPSFQNMSWETKNKLYEIIIDLVMDKSPNILMKLFNHKEHYDKMTQIKLLQRLVENPILGF